MIRTRFNPLRSAEDIETVDVGLLLRRGLFASTRFDPQRILKLIGVALFADLVLSFNPLRSAEDIETFRGIGLGHVARASTRFDPQRILKPCQHVARDLFEFASTRFDPQRILKLHGRGRYLRCCRASTRFDPQRILKPERVGARNEWKLLGFNPLRSAEDIETPDDRRGVLLAEASTRFDPQRILKPSMMTTSVSPL